jgi:hypothetical protein
LPILTLDDFALGIFNGLAGHLTLSVMALNQRSNNLRKKLYE